MPNYYATPDIPGEKAMLSGARWWCAACDVGLTSPFRPVCWCCGSAVQILPNHQYKTPTAAGNRPQPPASHFPLPPEVIT